jgi:hypothetical protein
MHLELLCRHLQGPSSERVIVLADNLVTQCLDIGQCKSIMKSLFIERGGCDQTVYLIMKEEIR